MSSFRSGQPADQRADGAPALGGGAAQLHDLVAGRLLPGAVARQDRQAGLLHVDHELDVLHADQHRVDDRRAGRVVGAGHRERARLERAAHHDRLGAVVLDALARDGQRPLDDHLVGRELLVGDLRRHVDRPDRGQLVGGAVERGQLAVAVRGLRLGRDHRVALRDLVGPVDRQFERRRDRDVDELARLPEPRVVAARDEDAVEALGLGPDHPLRDRLGALVAVVDVGDVVERVDVGDRVERDLGVGRATSRSARTRAPRRRTD